MVKDDGLAAGKGVVVTDDLDEAMAHAAACQRVVIEEYLDGPEVSLFCVTDGVSVVALLPAQDFKRIGDGDTGPNTGGMGAYAPLEWLPDGFVDEIVATVAVPTIREMATRGTPFAGLLYIGLAVTGMLATAGFSDILDMGFERRYDLFDLRVKYPPPLVPRRLRLEVASLHLGDTDPDLECLEPQSVSSRRCSKGPP